MRKKSITKEQKAAFLADMRETLTPGDTLHCIIRNVATSGMSRSIDVYRFHCVNGKVEKDWLSWRIATACGFSWDEKRECIRVSGCGMDMCHHIVYTLGRVLWPDGFGVAGAFPNGANGRPSTKEQAAELVSRGMVFRGRNGDTSGWENDGGYALKAEQL